MGNELHATWEDCLLVRKKKHFLIWNFMESSYSEADNSLVGQEIPSLLWNQKFNYRVHNNPPMCPDLSQLRPVYYFFKDPFQ
jgi:hypothetical protein